MKSLVRLLKSTLIGGVFFLVPLVLLIIILSKAHELMLKIAQPLSEVIPLDKIGGVAVANILVIVLLLLVCLLAGLLATRPKFKAFQQYLEEKILGPIPGYRVIKAFVNSLEIYENNGEKMVPVLVALEQHQKLGFEVERSGKDRVVVYLPDAPSFITGAIVVVSEEQVTRLEVPLPRLKDCMEQFGFGASDLLQAAKGKSS
ncbi:MAG: hypothetical protein R3252_04395 [Robiginitalea sp.]|nr:hypothetical protein [Robiginitalea sp.]